MDAIYSSASVTLVAATGTGADSGLSGWSALEDREQPSVQLEEDFRLGVLPYYQREMLDCDHAGRAWTYQETCLSQRCLVFLNGFVYFHCNRAVFAEHTNTDVPGIMPEASANNLGKSEVEGSALRKYAQHVDSFTFRRLTFQTDGLDAFKGIENAISDALGVKKMLYGLPASCFDWVLLWTGRGKLQRRAGFPSWSWVGWTGGVMTPEPSDGGYEQTWLLRATWIHWYLVELDGTCRPPWDSTDGSCRVSPLVSDQVLEAEEWRASPEAGNADDRSEVADVGGEETSDEDDEGEQDPCPTYGHSTPQDAFGRSLHPEVRQMIPLLCNYGATAQLRPSSCTEIGALCFEAPVIALTVGRPQSAKATTINVQSVSLHDRQDRLRGFLFVPDCDSWSGSDSNTVTLVLVSITSCTDLSSHHYSGYAPLVYEACGMEYTLDDYLHSAVQQNVDFFDLLNVFALWKSERTANVIVAGSEVPTPIYERTGVGFIHRTALQDLDVSWENIVLA